MNYLSIYNSIISSGINRLPFIGCHRHRIVPGYLGGQYTDDNICYLTRQEHRIVHAIRFKLWNNKCDAIACQCLGGTNPGGYNLDETTKAKIAKKAIGRIAWNKGVPNPAQSERFKKNNPMKNPITAKIVADKNRGKPSGRKGIPGKPTGRKGIPGPPSPRKITKTFIYNCKQCGKLVEKIATKNNLQYNQFCCRSCQATYTNTRRKGFKNKLKLTTLGG